MFGFYRRLFFVCLTGSHLLGDIVEVHNISEAKQYFTENTLYLWDIDNTILRAKNYLGSVTWFYHLYNECKDPTKDRDFSALFDVLSDWCTFMALIPHVAVEAEINEVVGFSQSMNNSYAIGFTTRGVGEILPTKENLAALNIDFFKSSPSKHSFIWENSHWPEPAIFFSRLGILFCSRGDKALCLSQLLDSIGYFPQKIIFINDKKDYLKQIEAECQRKGISFTGIRYGFLDETTKNYDKLYKEKKLKPKKAKELLKEQISNLKDPLSIGFSSF